MRRFMSAAGVAMGGLALMAAGQGVASAATTTTTTVPSCVVAQEKFLVTVWVDVTNNCSTQQRVQVVYTDRTDPTCYTIQPGQTAYSRLFAQIGHFKGLISC
ncbi:hypothetical protein [Kitasatospora sp. A2-31]|uniref:hypothetical protein n=1 Tax=Kitasatospora sp. A2-31 TaxID=2916414 RepID=UPI001EEC090F|nr:hypothetical protein [Kitasatospora sp. A2-31]MCG6495734.1 hypothetical protein [Kitasatospora sp. A2-31]